MPRSITLADLRIQAQRLADMENSGFVTSTEWNSYLSGSYCELYDLLVQSGMHYFEKLQTVSTSGADTYRLPDDHYATIGVDFKIDNTHWTTVPEMQISERNFFPNTGYRALGFRLVGGNLVFYPTPNSGQTYRHLYVPAPADLTLDSQTVDGVSGWEQLVAIDAAIKALTKEESDTVHLERERARMIERIQANAENRQLIHNRKIADTESSAWAGDVLGDPANWRWRYGY